MRLSSKRLHFYVILKCVFEQVTNHMILGKNIKIQKKTQMGLINFLLIVVVYKDNLTQFLYLLLHPHLTFL